MTLSEAKQLVEECGLNIEEPLHEEVMQIIRQAIDRRTPQKAIPHIVDVDFVNIIYIRFRKGTKIFKCPCCSTFISRAYDSCYKCGQAIDWSDTNDRQQRPYSRVRSAGK